MFLCSKCTAQEEYKKQAQSGYSHIIDVYLKLYVLYVTVNPEIYSKIIFVFFKFTRCPIFAVDDPFPIRYIRGRRFSRFQFFAVRGNRELFKISGFTVLSAHCNRSETGCMLVPP